MSKILGLMLAVFMVSCVVQTPKENMNAIQDKWELISLDGQKVMSDQPVYLEFDKDGQVSGYSGCNRLNGIYAVSDVTIIKFNQIASTRMMCSPQQMDIEHKFLEMMNTTDNFTVRGDELSMNVGRRAPLAVFQRMSKEAIVNKYWKLIELEGKKVEMAENQEREQYFTLRSDNTISGFAGCNQFNGTFKLQDGMRIKFNDNMAVSMKACPDVKVNEHEFLQVFSTADNYTIVNDVLSLNVGRRMPLARFEAVYF